MSELILPIEILAEQFRRLPGVGKKTAVKYAFKIIDMPQDMADEFVAAILNARTGVVRCSKCHNYSEGELCPICESNERDSSVICVVEDPKSIMAFERAGSYTGLYHVLGGVISPIKGIGPDKLHISELLKRVKEGEVAEVIIATNPTLEGETTAMYISGLLKEYGVKISRLAYGIPAGGDLEYTDELTLSRAIEGRRELN